MAFLQSTAPCLGTCEVWRGGGAWGTVHSPSGQSQAAQPLPRAPQALVGQDERLQDEQRQWLASPDNQAVAAQCALDLSLPEAQLPASVATELRRLELQGR